MPASKKPKTEKICRQCKHTFMSNNSKQVSCSSNCNMAYARSLNPSKFNAISKQRMRDRTPEQKREDAIRKREGRLQREYGISYATYLKMKEDQNNTCFLCKKYSKLVIDHDHETGKVRKLLCHPCNRGLGFFEDNSETLLAASQYIKDNK